jgi:hypothetical protein
VTVTERLLLIPGTPELIRAALPVLRIPVS